MARRLEPLQRATPVGILTTTGRKSGEPRESPLLFLREGNRIVLVASQGGARPIPCGT